MSVITEGPYGISSGKPAATRVFEKLGIDYCCGGNKSLDEACRAANLNTDEVLDLWRSLISRRERCKKSTTGRQKLWRT